MPNLSTTKKTKTWLNKLSVILYPLFVVVLTACGNPQDDGAELTLYLGGGSGKVSASAALDYWPPEDADLHLLTYDVLLKGPAGQEIPKNDIPGDTGKINFEQLTPGTWDIRVEAYSDGQYYAHSFITRTLTIGKNNVFMMMKRADDYEIEITIYPDGGEVAKGFSYVFSANTFAGSKLGSVDIASHSSYRWSVDGHKSSGTYITSIASGSKGDDGSTVGNLNAGHLTVGSDETATELTIKAESVNSLKDDPIYGTVTVKVVDVADAAKPVILVQPKGGSYGQNMSANELKVEASSPDGGNLAYQWYSSTDKINWSPASGSGGAGGDHYMPSTAALGTTYYKVVITNTNYGVNGNTTATAESEVAAVTVSALVNAAAPSIREHPKNASYIQNAPADDLTVEATSDDKGVLTYQWYIVTSTTSEGVEIPGATEAHYIPATTSIGTIWYYVVVTNTNNNVNGDTAAVTTSNRAEVKVAVKLDAQTPTITTQPMPADYALNSSVTALNVIASVADGGVLSYQWYKSSTENVSGGIAISGATNAYYTPVITPGINYYYVIVTNTNSSVNGNNTATFTSNVVAVTVEDAFSYTVANETDWTNTITAIKARGNNENSIINIASNFNNLPGNMWSSINQNTFGQLTGINVTIRGNLYTLTLNTDGCFLAIGAGQTVIMEDLYINTVSLYITQRLIIVSGNGASFTMKGNSSVSDNKGGGGVKVANGAKFTMKDNAKVYDNTVDYAGGGVYVTDKDSEFTMMDNSVVYGNEASASNSKGGGVYIEPENIGGTYVAGNFIMKGGSVHDNTAVSGGGVYVECGTFIMENDASVYNNNASTSNGGGVYVYQSTFTMEGDASVHDNKSILNNGGGVFADQSTFTMQGDASVCKNEAYSSGGGVFVMDNAAFTMEGNAKVYENIANSASGGEGGGVFVGLNSGLSMQDNAKVYENKSNYRGGGIFVEEGTFTMQDSATVSGNTAGNQGGGVYLTSDIASVFTMTGGIISGNTADQSGGGVYVATTASFTKTGGGIIYGSENTLEVSLRNEGTQYGGAAVYSVDFGGSDSTLWETDDY